MPFSSLSEMVSRAARTAKNVIAITWHSLLELDNNLLGLIVCALAVYDWIIFYDKLDRALLYYSQRIYTLPSLSILAVLSSALYLTFGGIILLSLKRPLSRYTVLLPNLVAVIAGFGVYVFVLMPSGNAFRISVYVALLFVVLGTVIILISLVFLRQAFSITPQARFLVTSGPYALVRHPMYIGNILWLFGVALLIDSWEAIGLFFICAALQICRALYEENLLQSAFPEYIVYKRRVGRFFPRVKFGRRVFPFLAVILLVSPTPVGSATPPLYTAGKGSYPRCFSFTCSSRKVSDPTDFALVATKHPLVQLAANTTNLAKKCDAWYEKAISDDWFNKDEAAEVLNAEDNGDMDKLPSCKGFDDLVARCSTFVFHVIFSKRGEPIDVKRLPPRILMNKLEENKGCVALAGYDTICETLEAIAKQGIVLSDYRQGLMADCFSKQLRESRKGLVNAPAV